jgi:polyisoprenoid-binding protein YceI
MATKWVLDRSHSEIEFKVRHMMISNVGGSFQEFTADVETEDDDFESVKVHFEIGVNSINTNNEQRDQHLKSPDFFDAANHPKIIFDSTKFEKTGGGNYKLHGNLTIRETTKPVSFDVEYGGTINDPWGNVRAGFTLEGKVNRKEYGLHWSALTETGGLVAGDDVKFTAGVEFVKQA